MTIDVSYDADKVNPTSQPKHGESLCVKLEKSRWSSFSAINPSRLHLTENPSGCGCAMRRKQMIQHRGAGNRLRFLNLTRGATSLHTYEYKLRASGHRREVVENASRKTTYAYDELSMISRTA